MRSTPPASQARTSKDGARPRRGRPPKIDTDQLLRVAREVFLERGFRATTAEVAERAGVSEGTLFHRFKTKEALFREAMQLSEDDVPRLLVGAVDAVEGIELDEALTRLAVALLDIGRVGMPLLMMSWSNPGLGESNDGNAERYRFFMRHLAGFFEAQMAAGRLRRMDAEILSRVFLGSIQHYCMTRIIAPESAAWIVPEGMFVRGLVDLVLHGSVAETAAKPPRQQLRGL